MEKYESFVRIMEHEMSLAVGCTEPGAISFTASVAREHAPGEIKEISCALSVNIVKNAASVKLPNTEGRCGVDLAAALGAVIGKSCKGLAVLGEANTENVAAALELIAQKCVKVSVSDKPLALYIEVTVKTDKSSATAIVAGSHDNIVYIEQDGVAILDKLSGCEEASGENGLYDVLSLENIVDFATNADEAMLSIVKNAVETNRAICNEGFKGNYGLNSGKQMKAMVTNGIVDESLIGYAAMVTAAGVDARMAGCSLPAFSNSGSGNQGITATMPVVAIGDKLNCSAELVLRACTVSNLVNIFIKQKLGKLSPVCGAVPAGTGSSCGVLFLFGKGAAEMEYTVKNMLSSVAGMFCDGAKASCALKVTACVMMGIQSALLACERVSVGPSDGIVGNNADETIDNYSRVINEGMSGLDLTLMDIIINKSFV